MKLFGKISTRTQGIVTTKIVDVATGRTVKEQRCKNLLFDSGLNYQAGGGNFSDIFKFCKIGSSNAANSISSGAVTFTQSGNTITASTSFFTAAMVGALFKWGTGSGGNETYITAQSGTTATVSTSATVSTPTVATVWNVQFTGLQSTSGIPLVTSATYQAVATPYTLTGNQLTLTRTFIFANQATPYTVNEIGYSNGSGGSGCNGRVVLPSSDVVGTSQFYVVTWTFTFTVTPNSIQAVGNVGTNIDTSGNFMLTAWDSSIVNGVGGIGDYQGNANGFMDKFNGFSILFNATTVSLPSSISAGALPTISPAIAAGSANVTSAGATSIVNGLAVMVATATASFSVAATGQTINALLFGQNHGGTWNYSAGLNLTNTFTAPNGTLAGSFTLKNNFGRTLTN